jgi:DNA-binding NarL/FixJ family response regulator
MRRGLRALVESEFKSVLLQEVATGRDVIEKVQQSVPDIFVIDLDMPDAMDSLPNIVKAAPEVPLLGLIAQADAWIIRRAMQLGGRGYVLKSESDRDLVSAIRAVLQGRTFLPAGSHALFLVPEKRGKAAVLSVREEQVLHLLASGNKNREVAAALGISIRTAENHRARIMKKLKLKSLSELILYAIRNRIVQH